MYYFNDTIQAYTIGIGSLFNKLKIQRIDKTTNPETIKEIDVSLTYAGKLHWYYKKFKNFPDKAGIKNMLPLMAFKFDGLALDEERLTNKFESLKFDKKIDPAIKKWIQTAVPYKFTFTLGIWTKYQSDLNQILEQVLPIFVPTTNLHIKEIPILNVYRTCKVSLNNISPEVNYEFDAESGDRILQYEISINLDGYLYPPIKEDALIKYIDIKFYTKYISNSYSDEEIIITENDTK